MFHLSGDILRLPHSQLDLSKTIVTSFQAVLRWDVKGIIAVNKDQSAGQCVLLLLPA